MCKVCSFCCQEEIEHCSIEGLKICHLTSGHNTCGSSHSSLGFGCLCWRADGLTSLQHEVLARLNECALAPRQGADSTSSPILPNLQSHGLTQQGCRRCQWSLRFMTDWSGGPAVGPPGCHRAWPRGGEEARIIVIYPNWCRCLFPDRG